MAYDKKLAERVRDLLHTKNGYVEKKMFGGICFMLFGNMLCGVVDDKLMARVGKDNYLALLKRKYADPMDFTGKPMKGMIYVYAGGIKTKKNLQFWIDQCLEFVEPLPKKKK